MFRISAFQNFPYHENVSSQHTLYNTSIMAFKDMYAAKSKITIYISKIYSKELFLLWRISLQEVLLFSHKVISNIEKLGQTASKISMVVLHRNSMLNSELFWFLFFISPVTGQVSNEWVIYIFQYLHIICKCGQHRGMGWFVYSFI